MTVLSEMEINPSLKRDLRRASLCLQHQRGVIWKITQTDVTVIYSLAQSQDVVPSFTMKEAMKQVKINAEDLKL